MNMRITTLDTQQSYTCNALLDSGATDLYVDKKWILKHGIQTTPLQYPQKVYNADGTPNAQGQITHQVQLRVSVQGHSSNEWFHVVDLGGKSIIIGMTWLKLHNPTIDWISGKLSFKNCPKTCHSLNPSDPTLRQIQEQNPVDIPDEFINSILTDHQICAYENPSTKIAAEAAKTSTKVTLDDIKKGPYKDFIDVFSEEGFQELPPHRHWDHAIDLTPDWETKRWKPRIYPLSPQEKAEMNKQLDELIASGRIEPSKSPLASPTFFVGKKDGKLRMVIDYRKLNDITIKNSYPIPLIPELVHKWKGCKRFTKLDV